MTRKDFIKVVKQFSGWVEGGVAYFPSTYHAERCRRILVELVEKSA